MLRKPVGERTCGVPRRYVGTSETGACGVTDRAEVCGGTSETGVWGRKEAGM